MNLEEILHNDRFRLPLKNKTKKSYYVFLKQLFKDYIAALENNLGFLEIYDEIRLDEARFISKVKSCAKSILQIIASRNQNKGNPYHDFEELMGGLFYTLYNDAYCESHIPPGATFYRCVKAGKLQKQSRFFHARFGIPEKIGPTRFSVPGFPSLYLANSLALGYLECRAAKMNELQAVKFENKAPLHLLDLDFHTKVPDTGENQRKNQRLGALYPIYAASFTIYEDQDKNPQEYIIPQYMCTWLKSVAQFDGILYASTKTASANYTDNFYNLIFPPKHTANSGYCTWLKDTAFKMSDVCFWQQDQAKIESYFSTEYPALGVINDEVKTIEWPPAAVKANYPDTEVGQMEFYMRYHTAMDTKTIHFKP